MTLLFSNPILVYRDTFLIATLHPHKSCIFNMRLKGISWKGKLFVPAGIAAEMVSWISFSVFVKKERSLPFGFIYLEMVGNHSCRLQSMVHIKQFNFFLSCHDFSLLLSSTSSITSGSSYGSNGVFQGLQYCTKCDEKYMRSAGDHF